jgi:hypothetical protein
MKILADDYETPDVLLTRAGASAGSARPRARSASSRETMTPI